MFESWLIELRDCAVEHLGRRELCDAAAASARLRAAVDAFDARLGAAIELLDDGGPGASVLFRGASRCSVREADRRARRAEALAALPSAAAELADGAITAEHVDVLARAAAATSAEAVERSGLVRTATQRPADLLRNDVLSWTRRHRSPASLEEAHRRRVAARRCVVIDGDDEMTVVHAELDPVSGAKVRAALDSATDRLFRADGGRDGARDVRTSEQRRADALIELLTGDPSGGSGAKNRRSCSTGPPGPHPGDRDRPRRRHRRDPRYRADPAVRARQADLHERAVRLVFSTDGQPLWHGTGRRLADENQVRGLIARDQGCVVCGAHHARCEAHHVRFAGLPVRGPTDIDNLALVCRHHHHLIHDQGYRLHHGVDRRWELTPPGRTRDGP
ncbi:MAG: HNH endonuclease signature motif containing protein [Acidimicrobiales bacterium]